MALDVITYPEDFSGNDPVIVALHGRNANKRAFLPFVRQMACPHTRWILPSGVFGAAPDHDVRWWFQHETQNLLEIKESRRRLMELMQSLLEEGVPSRQLILMGFSQGAVMSVDVALRFPLPLGGLIALSGYISHPELLERERRPVNASIPIFLAHGVHDRLLPIRYGRENCRVLTSLGASVEYHEYDTGHRINRAEMEDIKSFLARHMFCRS